jgi:hypothetical protein
VCRIKPASEARTSDNTGHAAQTMLGAAGFVKFVSRWAALPRVSKAALIVSICRERSAAWH